MRNKETSGLSPEAFFLLALICYTVYVECVVLCCVVVVSVSAFADWIFDMTGTETAVVTIADDAITIARIFL